MLITIANKYEILEKIGEGTFGKVFKGPKLTRISPNKTYSGTFGGFALSILLTSILINYSILDFNLGRTFPLLTSIISADSLSTLYCFSIASFLTKICSSNDDEI